MGLNTELAGKSYPAVTYEVTPDAIRRYAAATNERNPAFTGRRPVAPPAFPMVPAGAAIVKVMFDPDLGANVIRLVHGEQEHVFHRLIAAGDVLTVETSLERVDVLDTGETFTVLTRLADRAGETAAELRSLMFIRGSGGRSGRREEASPEIAFEVSEKVDQDQTHRYAEASGDHNPIHVDEDYARNAAGLPGIILHGMCTFAFAARAVVDSACGGDPSRLGRIKARFSRPVFPGQTLTTRGWAEGGREGAAVYGFETLAGAATVIRNGAAEVSPG